MFDQVHLNAGDAYDVRHGNFRAPVDGTYEFSVSMLVSGGRWSGVEIVKVGFITTFSYCQFSQRAGYFNILVAF